MKHASENFQSIFLRYYCRNRKIALRNLNLHIKCSCFCLALHLFFPDSLPLLWADFSHSFAELSTFHALLQINCVSICFTLSLSNSQRKQINWRPRKKRSVKNIISDSKDLVVVVFFCCPKINSYFQLKGQLLFVTNPFVSFMPNIWHYFPHSTILAQEQKQDFHNLSEWEYSSQNH